MTPRPRVVVGGARALWRPRKMLIKLPVSSTKACKLACAAITASNRNGLTLPMGCGQDVCYSPLLFDVFFASARYALYRINSMIVRFSEDPDIPKDLVRPLDGVGGNTEALHCLV